MKRIIIGYGEVGKAFGELCTRNNLDFEPIDIMDRYDDTFFNVMHVCIPHNSIFCAEVRMYATKFQPDLIVIHSTVPVGTMLKLGLENVAYTYVTGRHPQLADEMTEFEHLIAADSESTKDAARYELMLMGITSRNFRFAYNDLELAKLADTTYYGLCIAWHKELRLMAEYYGVDTDTLRNANEVYNAGYAEIDSKYLRPELTFEPGHIGGHCVVPNTNILLQDFPENKLLRAIVEAR